jgi:hypothetical protein
MLLTLLLNNVLAPDKPTPGTSGRLKGPKFILNVGTMMRR